MASTHTHPPECGCASHAPTNPSMTQTLSELDFERSIHNAALSGNLVRLRKLLCLSTANLFDSSGYTPLHYASRAGYLECVEVLLEAGADLDARTRGLGTTALMRAVVARRLGIVEVLVAKGADVDLKDFEGRDAVGLCGDLEQMNNESQQQWLVRRKMREILLQKEK
ncbi:UNVERIFIED_CONTAM: Ankyrin repeat domain-containing protein 39 [Siphonaria sp. JEL0065]|nr:Ankyrin repeat domain-containing protein 39 [Siphonaria sp. JEL0065]